MHTGSPLEQPEIDEIVRLQKFAYVVVRFPKILPLVRKLVHLNLGCLYLVVHRISYLLLYFRQAYQTSWREMFHHAWKALRQY